MWRGVQVHFLEGGPYAAMRKMNPCNQLDLLQMDRPRQAEGQTMLSAEHRIKLPSKTKRGAREAGAVLIHKQREK